MFTYMSIVKFMNEAEAPNSPWYNKVVLWFICMFLMFFMLPLAVAGWAAMLCGMIVVNVFRLGWALFSGKPVDYSPE